MCNRVKRNMLRRFAVAANASAQAVPGNCLVNVAGRIFEDASGTRYKAVKLDTASSDRCLYPLLEDDLDPAEFPEAFEDAGPENMWADWAAAISVNRNCH